MSAVLEHVPAVPAKREKSAYERLKRRERRFVDQYVIGCSAAEALRQCGYKGLHPNAIAHKWLKKPDVAAAVDERTEQHLLDTTARKHKTLEQVISIAYADPRKVVHPETGKAVPLEQMDAATAAAISSVEVENISIDGESGTRYKYRFWDKGKALDRLGQWQRLWDAPGTKVNVDARSVTVNNDGGGDAALRAVSEMQQRLADIARRAGASIPHQDRPVLPAESDHGAGGHGTSLDVCPNQGGGGGA